METNIASKKIAILDFGGQYAHLIASRIRRLGTYSEIVHPDEFGAVQAKEYAGIIYSGGPSSVYDEGAPVSDPEILNQGVPVLGICYGHQLMMKQAGGVVHRSRSREYGPAYLHIQKPEDLFQDEHGNQQALVWMSHGDEVSELPEGFQVYGQTDDCRYAAVGDPERKLYGLQFHPEVTDTHYGDVYLFNFLTICGSENTWSLSSFLDFEIDRIREQVKDRKVFMLLSGGVDSTVAFALLAKSLPADHLRGLFVDTGFMRHREIDEVKGFLAPLGVNLETVDVGELYYKKLEGISEPETKRNIIGELFVDVQQNMTRELGLNAEEWFLGQGTIYPDTIESGGTKNSTKIKTHHNRVDRIQELLEKGQIVEPIHHLYKDEVRNLGRLLGLPERVVERHPFPGPGLAVRCLCESTEDTGVFGEDGDGAEGFADLLNTSIRNSEEEDHRKDLDIIEKIVNNEKLTPVILPVRSVGVQGDNRTYARPLALFRPADEFNDWEAISELARKIPGRFSEINRVVLCTASRYEIKKSRIFSHPSAYLTKDRIELLRTADRIVNDFVVEKNLYNDIWQFPVVLAPIYLSRIGETQVYSEKERPESVILRPVRSMDAMTASFYPMAPLYVKELSLRLLSLVKIDAVFYDVTSKPPGTIEWE